MNTAYFVDGIHGNDANSGRREDKAWRTIQKAADVLEPGNTAWIMAGLYNEHVQAQNSGELHAPITFSAYPRHDVTIDGTGIPLPEGPELRGLFEIDGKDYVTVSGLAVTNSARYGILAERMRGAVIKHCRTYNTVQSGIMAHQAQDVFIDDNEIELACNPGLEECLTVSTVTNFVVSNNRVHHDGPGTGGVLGVDIKHGSFNGQVFGNHIYNSALSGLYIDGALYGVADVDIFNNVIHDATRSGIIVASERGGTVERIRIFNNIVYRCGEAGLWLGDWFWEGTEHRLNDIKIINNTFWNNGEDYGWSGGGVYVKNAEATNIGIRNNICSQNHAFQIVIEAGQATADNNLTWPFRGRAQEIHGEIEADPVFINPLCRSNPSFHLAPASPAIDAGDGTDAPDDDFDGTERPQGDGYDIGAYEYMA
jgi:hypothetical protein